MSNPEQPNPEYAKAPKEEIYVHPDAVGACGASAAVSAEFLEDIQKNGLAGTVGIGKVLAPKVDLSFRGKKAVVHEEPVVLRELHEEAAVLEDLIGQFTAEARDFPAIHAAARGLASALTQRLRAEKSREATAMNDEIDALARESLRRLGGGNPVDANCPLDSSMDGQRWASEAMQAMGAADFQLGELLPSFFNRALGAGVVQGRKRERESMIEELKPIFRNVEILDMWAEKMHVKDAGSGLPLHADPDARRWAREFITTIDDLERKEGHKLCDPATFDEGFMTSWFASAMVAAHDWSNARHEREDALKRRQRNAHVFGPLLFTTILQAANVPLFDVSTTRTEKGDVFRGLCIRVQPWKREHGQSAPQMAVIVAWKTALGPGFWSRLRAKWRLFWDLCPACNSDAPGVDQCECCNGFRSSEMAEGDMPEAMVTARKAVWLRRFMQGKGIRPMPREESVGCISETSDEAEKVNVGDDEARLGY